MLLRGVGDRWSEPSGGKACSFAAKVDRCLNVPTAAVFPEPFHGPCAAACDGRVDDAGSRRPAKSNRDTRFRQQRA